MKKILAFAILFPCLALAQSNYEKNTQNRTLIDNETTRHFQAVDAKDLKVLADAAQKWLFNPQKKHYMRIPHGMDGVRYEIPIDEIKAEGFLPADWADRFGAGQSVSVLGHPYVVSVARYPDPEGKAISPFLPNEKYRFDMLATIGASNGNVLPPKPVKVPVFLRFTDNAWQPITSPLLTDYLALGGVGFPLDPGAADPANLMTVLQNNAVSYEAPRTTTVYTPNFNFSDMNGGSADWQFFLSQLSSRFSGELDASTLDRITNALVGVSANALGGGATLTNCRTLQRGLDAEFDEVMALGADPDGSYDNDSLLLCNMALRPDGTIQCRRNYCNGTTPDVQVTTIPNPTNNIVRDNEARPRYGMQVCLSAGVPVTWCSPFEPARWGGYPHCQNAVPTCSSGGSPPPAGCTTGNCGCDVYLFDEYSYSWGNLPSAPFIRYEANCAATMFDTSPETGSPRTRPVLEVAVEDTAGDCEINPDDDSQMKCKRYCNLFWDEDGDGIKDEPNPFFGGLFGNCADAPPKAGTVGGGVPPGGGGNSTGSGGDMANKLKGDYNQDKPPAERANNCVASPPSAPKDPTVDGNVHEALCDKRAEATGPNPPEFVLASEIVLLARGGPAGPCTPGQYCEPAEWIDQICMVVIENWDKGWDVDPASSSSSIPVHCDPVNMPNGRSGWICRRRWRQDTQWTGSGYPNNPPPPDFIANTACIDGTQIQVPWIKPPNVGTALN